MRGVTARTRLRLARHLIHQVKVEKYAGRSATKPGAPEWTDLGLYNGRLIERSGISYQTDGVAQNYDATVLIQAQQVFADRNARYRVTVTELYAEREAEVLGYTDPTVKRTRVLETTSITSHYDEAGNDLLLTLRCVNGRA